MIGLRETEEGEVCLVIACTEAQTHTLTGVEEGKNGGERADHGGFKLAF